jgi:hypothetical protein
MPFDISGITLTSPAGATLSMKDGSSNSWMEVSANGVLTRPQTPYFRGQIQGRGSTYNAGGGPLLVNGDVNFGNCWNNITGLFTAPVAGYYMMVMGSICGPAGSGYLHARKNNVTMRFTHWNFQTTSWHYVSLACVMLAAVNDYFSWHVISQSPAAAGVHGNTNHAMYSIALLA